MTSVLTDTCGNGHTQKSDWFVLTFLSGSIKLWKRQWTLNDHLTITAQILTPKHKSSNRNIILTLSSLIKLNNTKEKVCRCIVLWLSRIALNMLFFQLGSSFCKMEGQYNFKLIRVRESKTFQILDVSLLNDPKISLVVCLRLLLWKTIYDFKAVLQPSCVTPKITFYSLFASKCFNTKNCWNKLCVKL